jgi:hypothetical protein
MAGHEPKQGMYIGANIEMARKTGESKFQVLCGTKHQQKEQQSKRQVTMQKEISSVPPRHDGCVAALLCFVDALDHDVVS